jgi:predicted RNA polymerase sigma factor
VSGRPPHRSDVEAQLRAAAPRVLAAVVRRFGDFADAEDAVQEAMIDATRQWPAEGTPENPAGWLIAVASRRMTDRIRADSARRAREERLAVEPEPGATPEVDDTWR